MNEILAKLTQNEKYMGGGGALAVLGYIVGMILGNHQTCATYAGQQICSGISVNYFTWGNAGMLAILAALAGAALVVVLYLKVSGANVQWPVPVGQILLGLAGATLVLAALAVLMHFTNNLPDSPVLMYLADLILVGGGALAAWGAYQEWMVKKAA
jgi:hypothetical protein